MDLDMSELVELLFLDIENPISKEDWGFNNSGDHDEIRQAIADKSGGAVGASIYIGGLTVTGTVGQTVILSFLGGSGIIATGTLALTGLNAIAGGTHITITNIGSGYTEDPTQASAVVGTATSVTGTAIVASGRMKAVDLTDWQLYPVNWNDYESYSLRHQSAHNEMNSALGLPGTDLTDVDFKNSEKNDEWQQNHFNEHLAARTKLGI